MLARPSVSSGVRDAGRCRYLTRTKRRGQGRESGPRGAARRPDPIRTLAPLASVPPSSRPRPRNGATPPVRASLPLRSVPEASWDAFCKKNRALRERVAPSCARRGRRLRPERATVGPREKKGASEGCDRGASALRGVRPRSMRARGSGYTGALGISSTAPRCRPLAVGLGSRGAGLQRPRRRGGLQPAGQAGIWAIVPERPSRPRLPLRRLCRPRMDHRLDRTARVCPERSGKGVRSARLNCVVEKRIVGRRLRRAS